MPRSSVKALVVGAATLAVVGMTPLAGHAAATPQPPAAAAARLDLGLDPGMLAAMRRDLGLDDARIADRLTTEAAAPVVEKRLRKQLGTSFGGAWIPAGATWLTVAVTSEAAAATARKEGAVARLVRRSEADLAAQRAKLDRNSAAAGAVIRGWYVDPAANSVVVTAAPGAEPAARAFAERSGVATVTVRTAAEAPRPMFDIRGGDQ